MDKRTGCLSGFFILIARVWNSILHRNNDQFRLLDEPPQNIDEETLQALDDDWNKNQK